MRIEVMHQQGNNDKLDYFKTNFLLSDCLAKDSDFSLLIISIFWVFKDGSGSIMKGL